MTIGFRECDESTERDSFIRYEVDMTNVHPQIRADLKHAIRDAVEVAQSEERDRWNYETAVRQFDGTLQDFICWNLSKSIEYLDSAVAIAEINGTDITASQMLAPLTRSKHMRFALTDLYGPKDGEEASGSG